MNYKAIRKLNSRVRGDMMMSERKIIYTNGAGMPNNETGSWNKWI